MKTGRNDPCPCGSGKKYKRCCMAAEETAAHEKHTMLEDAGTPDRLPTHPADVEELEEAARRLPANVQRRILPVLKALRTHAKIDERSEEYETIDLILEKHRDEYEALVENEEEWHRKTEALFDEEEFVPMRFTTDDVKRAFDAVGYPESAVSANKCVELFNKAVIFLAHKTLRMSLSVQLIATLPGYIEQGRFIDAWIIKDNALITTDKPREVNIFLWHMFMHGFDAWEKMRFQAEAGILRDIGIDPIALRGMDVAEARKFLDGQTRDPANEAKIRKAFESRPEYVKAVTASLEAVEDKAFRLLERADAKVLLLSEEEIMPWVTIAEERFQKMIVEKKISPDKKDKKTMRIAGDMMFSLTREMARSIFTAERIAKLCAQFQDYRRMLLDAGEEDAAAAAGGAMVFLHPQTVPDDCMLLMGICYQSLRGEVHGDTAKKQKRRT
jgi:hypothetical protein